MATKKNIKEVEEFKIINNTIGSAHFIGIDNKKYLFPKPKTFRVLPYAVLEGMFNEFPNMVYGGDFIFEDKEVYKRFGLSDDELKKILPLDKIEEFLSQDAKVIEEELKEMSKGIQDAVAYKAKEIKLDSKKKIQAIKIATGFEVDAEDNLE